MTELEQHWYRLPMKGAGTLEDPEYPAYLHGLAERHAGFKIGRSPQGIYKVEATSGAHGRLESKEDVTRLDTSEVRNALRSADSKATADDLERSWL